MLAGLNVYVLLMFFAGLEGQQVDIFRYPENQGLSTLNLFASIAAFVFVIGAFLELGSLAHGYSQRPRHRARPVGRLDARVVRALTASAAQLRRGP